MRIQANFAITESKAFRQCLDSESVIDTLEFQSLSVETMSSELAETAGGASTADSAVLGEAEHVEGGQKKRRLEAAADSKAEAVVSEAEYKAKLKRLLKLVPADAIVDLLATM